MTRLCLLQVNKLIWPSPEGVGAIIPAEFEAMYRYVAESGMFPEALDPSSSLEPELMNLAIADLKAAGEDVYGQFYSSEQFQDTLTFCRDNATASVTLCKMRCNAGTEPPGTGAIFGAESCMVCEAGSASPGGQAACAPCQAGSVAPSPGMAHCVPDNPTSKALRAGLVAAAALLLLLLVPAWLLWRRSSRLSAELVAMQDGSLDSLNMDAPLVKALGFLREVERGEHNYTWQPWRKQELRSRAREMRLMLLSARNLHAPDVERLMMEGGEFGEDIVNFVVHNTAQRQGDQPKEQLSFWGALRRSTMSFPGIHGEGELDVEPIRESVCEEMNASLGKTFSVNMLSWVSRAHEGLLGAVLSHFLDDWGLSVKLRLSERKLLRFAGTIEKGHHDNPYHG